MRLTADTHSTGTLSRSYNFFLSIDNTCTAGKMASLAWKQVASHHEQLPAVDIPAGAPMSLVVLYYEGRFGETRSCGNAARFTPQAGRTYDVQFDVMDEGMQCPIVVKEADVGPLVLEDSSDCRAQPGIGGPSTNGVGQGIKMQIQVQPGH